MPGVGSDSLTSSVISDSACQDAPTQSTEGTRRRDPVPRRDGRRGAQPGPQGWQADARPTPSAFHFLFQQRLSRNEPFAPKCSRPRVLGSVLSPRDARALAGESQRGTSWASIAASPRAPSFLSNCKGRASKSRFGFHWRSSFFAQPSIKHLPTDALDSFRDHLERNTLQEPCQPLKGLVTQKHQIRQKKKILQLFLHKPFEVRSSKIRIFPRLLIGRCPTVIPSASRSTAGLS